MSESKQISNINTLRGLAALSVCMFHTTAVDGSFYSAGLMSKLSFLFLQGHLGVHVFFVISGFIIPYSLYKSNYSIRYFPKFMLKRYIRIAPTAWVSIFLMLLFYWMPVLLFDKYIEVFDPEIFSLKNIPANLLFIAPFFQMKWIISVLWTLNIEFQYYLFIGILFPFFLKRKSVIYFILILFSLSGWFYKIIVQSNYDSEGTAATLLVYHAPLFCMGIISFLYKIEKISLLEFFLGMLLFLAIGFFSMNQPVEILVGFFTGLFIVFIHFSNSITDFFGKISYSLYLNHIVFMAYIDAVFRLLFPQTMNLFANVFLIAAYYAIIFFACWVFYYFIEQYFHKLAQKIK